MPSGDAHCSGCAAPLAADQRYCLECGCRRGPARLDVLAMARGRAAPAAPLTTARAASAMAMPGPRALAAATLLVLGFGVFAGAEAGPRAADTLAASGRRAVVVVSAPAPAPPAAAAAAAAAAASSPQPDPQPTASAPASAPEPVPAASSPTPAATAEPKPKPKLKPGAAKPAPPPVKHVWVVSLTGHTLAQALAQPSPMPYLSQLVPRGLLLPRYAAVDRGSLANGVALLSGQAATDDQRAGCPTYADVDPAAHTGCVFGADVETLPGQLTAVGRTWRAYVEGPDPSSPPPNACQPDSYASQRDPLVLFHEIVDSPDCGADIAPPARLAPDAADAQSAPDLALVVPGACHDGRDAPCTEGAPAGLAAADAWLQATLAPLLASKAYADDGLVVVTFDAGPDDPAPGAEQPPVGALLLSRHVKAGATVDTAYTHLSLLRTLEDAFGVKPLAAAGGDDVHPFGEDVFTEAVTQRSP
jgi:hypothetical protein